MSLKHLYQWLLSIELMWRYPLGLPTHQLLRTISLLGRWSTSGSDRGIAHIFIATRNTIKEWEERDQTNKILGLTQGAREELCIIAFPLCICRLTLAWISSEISIKLQGMPNHLDRSSFTGTGLTHADWSLLLSGADWSLAPPFDNCFLWVPLSNSSSRSLTHFRSRRDRRLRPLFRFAQKTDKGIVCLADHLHSVTLMQVRQYCILYFWPQTIPFFLTPNALPW